MNPPRLEVTTSNETLQFDLPDGNDVAELRLNGQRLLNIHKLAEASRRQNKYWIILGMFLFVSSILSVSLATYIVLRLNQLPQDTAEIQEMIDSGHPPAFDVGHKVLAEDGTEGIIEHVIRGRDGIWKYKLTTCERWREQRYLTFKGSVDAQQVRANGRS